MAFITRITGVPIPLSGIFGANGLPSGVDNNDGNVRAGGTIADGDLFSSSSLGEGNPITTIISGVGPVEGAVPGQFNSGVQAIMVAQTNIAGVTSTVLQGGESNSANTAYTPLQLAVLRTYYYKTAVRQGNWNVFNGTFSPAVTNNTVSGAWNISNSVDNSATMRASGTDVAANTTQDAPGRLVFRDGSPNPVQSGYGPRYNW